MVNPYIWCIYGVNPYKSHEISIFVAKHHHFSEGSRDFRLVTCQALAVAAAANSSRRLGEGNIYCLVVDTNYISYILTIFFCYDQWPFQEPKMEVPIPYIRPIC